jgi:hypothetical protein
VWRLDAGNQLDVLVARGESITPYARPQFAVEPGRYELEVHAANAWPTPAQRLESPIATLRVSTR